MYSFCRNNPWRPLPATFNKEEVGKETFGRFKYIPCEIYKLDITDKQMKQLEKQLEYFKNNRDNYSYNLIGLILIFLHIERNRKKQICMLTVCGTYYRPGRNRLKNSKTQIIIHT